jgi:hypothetical protein
MNCTPEEGVCSRAACAAAGRCSRACVAAALGQHNFWILPQGGRWIEAHGAAPAAATCALAGAKLARPRGTLSPGAPRTRRVRVAAGG